MKTSLNKPGIALLSRLAKRLGVKYNPIPKGIDQIDLSSEIDPPGALDIYLWDWEYGLVTIKNPEGAIGNAILSAVTEKETTYREETPRFSHVCLHLKFANMLQVYRVDVIQVTSWKQEQDPQSHRDNYEYLNIIGPL